jgi:hypothetical protein
MVEKGRTRLRLQASVSDVPLLDLSPEVGYKDLRVFIAVDVFHAGTFAHPICANPFYSKRL